MAHTFVVVPPPSPRELVGRASTFGFSSFAMLRGTRESKAELSHQLRRRELDEQVSFHARAVGVRSEHNSRPAPTGYRMVELAPGSTTVITSAAPDKRSGG